METTTRTVPRLFLTDYASYNAGTQFEFGHWVDLTDFSDGEEFEEYIKNHFKECDEKSPLDGYGSIREEVMFTDFEGFPGSLYSECLWGEDLQKIFDYIDLDLPGEDNIEEWLGLHNEYCSEKNNDNEVYENDEEFFNMHFDGDPNGAVRAVFYGDYRYMDEYVRFDGYSNLESFNESGLKDIIDIDAIVEWKLENL